jgi:hypothetical protein
MSDTPRTNWIMDNVTVAINADTREQSHAHKDEARREIEELERERDKWRDIAERLVNAVHLANDKVGCCDDHCWRCCERDETIDKALADFEEAKK